MVHGRDAGIVNKAGLMDAPIERIEVLSYTVPTEEPESDGTLEWDKTTIVVAQVYAGSRMGLGYTYGHPAIEVLIRRTLAEIIRGRDAFAVTEAWEAMRRSVRNFGRPGLSSMAIAAVDTALWDLKARLLGLPLVKLLGRVHDGVPVYGSGGFTSYSIPRLKEQLASWTAAGIMRVKMKVGREPARDPARVREARLAIGKNAELFVDANGAYSRRQAKEMAQAFQREADVSWFEEPVPSEDLSGMRFVREHAPAGMDIAAGEYGYDLAYFQRMMKAGAVDVLQADATRCAGFTEFLRVGALCAAQGISLSAHTAPALHLHACCALAPVRHIEYFHDHVRIENLLFDGAPRPVRGRLYPDLTRPGLGLELKRISSVAWSAA